METITINGKIYRLVLAEDTQDKHDEKQNTELQLEFGKVYVSTSDSIVRFDNTYGSVVSLLSHTNRGKLLLETNFDKGFLKTLATPEQEAILVQKEFENGVYFNGKEMVEVPYAIESVLGINKVVGVGLGHDGLKFILDISNWCYINSSNFKPLTKEQYDQLTKVDDVGVWKRGCTYVIKSKYKQLLFWKNLDGSTTLDSGYKELSIHGFIKLTDLTELQELLKQQDKMLNNEFEVVKWIPKIGEVYWEMDEYFESQEDVRNGSLEDKFYKDTFPTERLCQKFCDKVVKLRGEM